MAQLFEFAAGVKARDRAMRQVDLNANEVWKRDMLMCLKRVCLTKPFFTADDVFDLARAEGVTSRTHDRRAFGPIMIRAHKDCWCVKATRLPRPCNRKSRHAAPLTVWQSLAIV
jgi:hypothetical protein